jgi:hypothetical protein
LAQKPWHVLSRSVQLLAAAGAAKVKISAAHSPAPQSLRNLASPAQHIRER